MEWKMTRFAGVLPKGKNELRGLARQIRYVIEFAGSPGPTQMGDLRPGQPGTGRGAIYGGTAFHLLAAFE
jgi:hypothetical protein